MKQNIPPEEFENKMIDKYGDKYTYIGGYVNSLSRISVRCNTCGSVMERTAATFLQRGTCKECGNINKRITHEEFERKIVNKFGNDFTLLSQYTRSCDIIKVRHNKCGTEYQIEAGLLIQKGSCKFCQPERLRAIFAKTKKEFVCQMRTLCGDEYSLLGDYVNANKPTLFKHNKCGSIYMAKPNGFLQGKRCLRCSIDARRIKNNLNSRITKRLRGRIWSALQGRRKSANTIALLGCSIDELKSHLEKLFLDGMSWENYGKNGWEIDHKRPCASYDLREDSQQKECFHYSNLRPLWARDNWRKGPRWNGKYFRGEYIGI